MDYYTAVKLLVEFTFTSLFGVAGKISKVQQEIRFVSYKN